jgi:hypothetical protein
VIRGDEEFSRALASGRETTFADQYMCMTPQFGLREKPARRPRGRDRNTTARSE